jgi:uncharacterized protein DUF6798
MRDRLAIGAAIIALTLLSYFQFPGHTYLGSDTQIYVPMLEHIWDSSALTRDLVAPKPHLAYTLYDEIAIALRWVTHNSFQAVLTAQQLLFRALQILGVYLLALSFPLARGKALVVAALFTLGATIAGPAVLTFEYEPVPRAFAVGLIFLAIGLAAQNHLMWADIAAALAFLYHPPTVWAFWAVYLWLVLRHRDYRDLWPLAAGIVLLFVSSRLQPGAAEPQAFFTRVGPELEKLQRMRASYNWISTWPVKLIWQYVLLWALCMIAFWRVRPKAARLFLIGMPALGILSVPVSYILLDQLKFGLIPQFQPARALLFVTAFAVILGASAGIRAAEYRRWIESVFWFVMVLAVPTAVPIFSISGRNVLLLLALAVALCGALAMERFRFAPALLAAAAIAPGFVLPYLAHVRNYPRPNLAGLEDLAEFARAQTPKDAVFLFGDAGSSPDPSIFRAESLRSVYVDWKSGGQMNFSEPLAREWWQRWQNTNELNFDPAEVSRLQGMGIDYLVLSPRHRLMDRQPAYENSQFVLYRR